MANSANSALSRRLIHSLVAISGLSALSWEIIWQVKSSLALGVSAWGTALTLAVTMGGMGIGSLAFSRFLKSRPVAHPMRIYAMLEIFIGCSGLCLGAAFDFAEHLDSWAYSVKPGSAMFVHVFAIILALGIPTFCMGATLPVFGHIARQYKTSIARLYGLNILGGATGALVAAFVLIPLLGITGTTWIIAAFNIAVSIIAFCIPSSGRVVKELRRATVPRTQLPPGTEHLIVMVTGFATLALEVAWFRSITAAFRSTTDAFAIMLSCVLIALGMAAGKVLELKRKKIALGILIAAAGILILLATPLVERFDIFLFSHTIAATHAGATGAPPTFSSTSPASLYVFCVSVLNLFLLTFLVIGGPVMLLGMAFPWILEEQRVSSRWGTLYALNTLAAIAGSILAAWLFLPSIGFARTAWLIGLLVAGTGLYAAPRKYRLPCAALCIVALLVAFVFESGVGRIRAQGSDFFAERDSAKLVEAFEGPEATASVIQYKNGSRRLVVDGASASGQFGIDNNYMVWMGRLPMLLHPAAKNALVICFGTGQTANAVRQENPRALDIVDINANIFKLAHNFSTNHKVLADPRVKPIVMDGRAYIRRTTKLYDVITLEPMPPTLAGVNALYSREFYELARDRLTPDGVIAQWLPFHGVTPHYAASIALTFQDIFPNAVLWIGPDSPDGILLGSKDDREELGNVLKSAPYMNKNELRRYGEYGEIITDDNQLLAYGNAVNSVYVLQNMIGENFDLLKQLTGRSPPQ